MRREAEPASKKYRKGRDSGSGSPQGGLFVFEGPDEVGKTVLAKALVERLMESGHHGRYLAFPGTDAGTLGHLVYRLHHAHQELGIQRKPHPTSLQLLHIAAHIDAIEADIIPALTGGQNVVLDRFWWSTWVYGRAAGISAEVLDAAIDVEQHYWKGVLPDAAFLIQRNRAPAGGPLWSFYDEIAAREQGRYPIHPLENTGTLETTLSQVLDHLRPYINGLNAGS